ncbi:MAG: hypothetical protein HC795_07700 [Coleofasciculaceae cyanobacterium RL_1_1]|nr:hypothetical protein [Coleofasciculaceae cyanobacterium RL_1_1]
MTFTHRQRSRTRRLSLAFLAGTIAAWLGSSAIVSAQTTFNNPNVFDDVRQGNERDPLLGGSDIDMMELIHRANLSGGRSLSEFIGSQSAQIQSAASDFRALQLQRLYQTQSVETPAAVSLDLSE